MLNEYLTIIGRYLGFDTATTLIALLVVILIVVVVFKRQVLCMFDIIYNFISEYLLKTAITDASVLTANSQLCLILTHTSIVLLFILGILFVKWCFRIASGVFFRG